MMTFNFRSFFRAQGIEYWVEGKNVRPGWVHITCPFCDDHSNHLGGNPEGGAVICWRCGVHSLWSLLERVGREPPHVYLRKYGTGKLSTTPAVKPREKRPTADACVLPATGKKPVPAAIRYLRDRGYDYAEIADRYDIRCTGPSGEYKFRIIIPVYWKGEIVSFVGRDYTGKQELRYKTASRDKEKIHHKDIVYGLDQAQYYDAVIVVEGIFDAWRIGPGAVATFGTSVTLAQVRELSRLKQKVYVLFDNEPEATAKALELVAMLMLLGKPAEILYLPPGVEDPDGLTPHAVEKLRANVFG